MPQVLDEWDHTIRAFRKHFIYTDGAGELCKSGIIKIMRAYLFPNKYAEMWEVIEPPIVWSKPLLPKSYDVK